MKSEERGLGRYLPEAATRMDVLHAAAGALWAALSIGCSAGWTMPTFALDNN
jgi:hypothetical protein